MIDKNLLKDIFPFKRQLILVMISNIMQAMMIVAIAYIIAYIADKLLLSRLESSTATPLLVLLFFFFCIKAILNYFNHYQMEKISLNVQSNLRKQLFEVLAQRSFLANSYAKGQWIALITKGVDKLDIYLTSFIPQLGLLSTIPLILLIFTFINDWISGLIFLITAPLIPFFMILIGKIADKENKKQWQVFQKLTMYMADLLSGLLIVKAYNQTQRQLSEINKNGKLFSQATLKVLRIAFISAFMLEFISTLSIAIIAVNIGLRLIYGHVEFLPVFFILLIAPQFYQPFRQFGSAFHDAMNGITASSEIYAMIDKLNCIKESKANLKFDDADMVQIELKNVYYKYQDSDKWAIDDLSLKIEKGKQLVLTGDNGAGKSTLFKLLLGIEKCQSGEILINDYNLADLDKQWWQSQIGWVAQEPYIFSATISENITLGRDFNLKEIEHICQLVNLDEFIKSLPQGYDTEITSAMNLSSGQKRRLGLTRALIGRPKLLLLDEPAAGMNPQETQELMEMIRWIRKEFGLSILLIEHDMSLVMGICERIYVLEYGCIIASGTPEEIQKNPEVIKAYLGGEV